MVPFLMTLSDLKLLIEIFNDTQYCAVSLRQLSFLLFSAKQRVDLHTRPLYISRLCLCFVWQLIQEN